MPLPLRGYYSVCVAVVCSECGVSQTRTVTLSEDVEPPAGPITCFKCSSCNPKAETLSRRDDFLGAMEQKWDAAGGREAYRRQLARERKRRSRAAQREATENKLAA
jgi:hypothetical protein